VSPTRPRPAFVGPPEIVRELTRQQRAGELAAAPTPLPPGTKVPPIRLNADTLPKLLPAAAGRALGTSPASKITEVIWGEGGDELAVLPAKIDIKLAVGLILLMIPVRCDQTGPATVQIAVAVGSPDRSAGLFAAAERRPQGPAAIVDRWADALIAFAWGAIVELANSVAATAGRDDNGDDLVPGEIIVDASSLTVAPFARHALGPLQK
jgi:hypothetical protein